MALGWVADELREELLNLLCTLLNPIHQLISPLPSLSSLNHIPPHPDNDHLSAFYIGLRPVMATAKVCQAYEQLQSGVLEMLDLKKLRDRLMQERRIAETRLLELRRGEKGGPALVCPLSLIIP